MKTRNIILIAFIVLSPLSIVKAQLINLKTVPVATGDQYIVQPTVHEGMANVSIALDDTLADPFVNPAKARKIQGTEAYMLPSFYHITKGLGGARTFTIGALTSGKKWFGGLGVAVQQLNLADRQSSILNERSTNNNYIWGELGRRLNSSLALGGSIFWSGLSNMGGIDLLNPQSESIAQHGHLLDLRLGLNGDTKKNGQYEALILFNQINMSPQISNQGPIIGLPVSGVNGLQTNNNTVTSQYQQTSPDISYYKTNTWGIHLGYDHSLLEKNWKIGSIFTFNYKSHPHIPNYQLSSFPYDPGNSKAFDIGIGSSFRSARNATIAVDFILEPIWSTTWANAQQNIYSNGFGSSIIVKKGDRIINNNFYFMNSILKTGLEWWEGNHVLIQAGILTKTYRYLMKQKDYVQNAQLRQKVNWREWTYSLSAGVFLKGLKIKYTALITTGTGQPGIVSYNTYYSSRLAANFANEGGDIIFAPGGNIALRDAIVFTNQIMVMIPI